ncbi:MAG: 50S ribosomal protein L15 [Candidatus Levyibacteriota bacterium]
MQLHSLPKITTKDKKRVGRGHGSGKVKTSGRGTKGQKARRDIKLHFEGGALPLIKRMPFLRGRSKNISLKPQTLVVNVEKLNVFSAKSVIDVDALVSKKILQKDDATISLIKILGVGDLNIPLTVKLPVSKTAQTKIEKAGGTVEN